MAFLKLIQTFSTDRGLCSKQNINQLSLSSEKCLYHISVFDNQTTIIPITTKILVQLLTFSRSKVSTKYQQAHVAYHFTASDFVPRGDSDRVPTFETFFTKHIAANAN